MANRTCSIDGCGKPHKARGWCSSHYNAWRAYGDPLGKPEVKPQRGCSVADCPHPAKWAGLCNAHSYRMRTHGDVQAHIPVQKKRRGYVEQCSVDGCTRKYSSNGRCKKHADDERKAIIRQEPCVIPGCSRPRRSVEHGWCATHYRRWRIYGDPLGGPPFQSRGTGTQSQPRHPLKTAEYQRNHARVRTARGAAWLQACEHCGEHAVDWATIHGRSGEHPGDYMPLCKACHLTYDGNRVRPALGEDHRAAKLTEEIVRAIRARYAAGEVPAVMAGEYGVITDSIWNVIHFRTWKHVA
jgi:hypothetical protein